MKNLVIFKLAVRLLVVMPIMMLFMAACYGQQENVISLTNHRIIWDRARHNAFTALESYRGYLYCAFREGANHHSYDGKIRVIRSKDGSLWEPVALISVGGEDLRDPKFIGNNGELILMIVSRTKNRHFSYTYSTENGRNWIQNEKTNDTWRWGANKVNGTVYSVGYSGQDREGRVYRMGSGKKWTAVKSNFFPSTKDLPNETEIFFDSNERMIALVRQERGKKSALLGVSPAPYEKWEWKSLNSRIGSPAGIMLENNKLLACVRLYNSPIRTSFVLIDVERGTMREDLVLPSGGDTGYAAIVKHNDSYYVSYNSSNNARKRTSIHLAEIRIGEK